MPPPTPAEHMQCELRKSALNSSERHFRHAIQPREHLRTTCCQPPCCSRCSLLAAAIPSHAHHAPSGALSEDVLGGPHRCTASMGSERGMTEVVGRSITNVPVLICLMPKHLVHHQGACSTKPAALPRRAHVAGASVPKIGMHVQ